MATIDDTPTVRMTADNTWHARGVVSLRPAGRKPRLSRGAEVLVRITVGAGSALGVVLVLILVNPALGPEYKVWSSVIGLSAFMVATATAGIARMEANKTRASVTANTENAVAEVRAEVRAEIREAAGKIMAEMRGLTESILRERPACDCAALSKMIEDLRSSDTRLEEFRDQMAEQVEKRLAEFAVEVFRTQDDGKVVPMQRSDRNVT